MNLLVPSKSMPKFPFIAQIVCLKSSENAAKFFFFVLLVGTAKV